MATTPSAVSLGGSELKPAPFVSTSYEYKTSGEYVIGGFLIVNLDGTIVAENAEDLISQMAYYSSLQTSTNCVNLTIGCEGGSDFLNGAGRIRNVDISQSSDQPFVFTYTITVAIETIDGMPAVDPDQDFLNRMCLTPEDARYILSYEESIAITGEGDAISSTDTTFNVSKSFIKGSGSISITCFGREICGVPQGSGIDRAIQILTQRANNLMNFTNCSGTSTPLSQYSGWQKWLDTKKITIDDAGSVTWSFDLYMTNGGGTPYAWVDVETTDQMDMKTEKDLLTKTVRGTIRGLSSATLDFIGNKASVNERISNAERALGVILPQITNGEWPSNAVILSGEEGDCEPPEPNDCPESEKATCYQRSSSSLDKSMVSGEIVFSAEYKDINSCKDKNDATIDTTIDENFPSVRHVEFIIPNLPKSVVQYAGDTPHKATVTVKGTIKGCDKLTPEKLEKLKACVEKELNKKAQKFASWLITNEAQTISSYYYEKTKSYVKCDS